MKAKRVPGLGVEPVPADLVDVTGNRTYDPAVRSIAEGEACRANKPS